MKMKQCSKCKQSKHLSDFKSDKRRKFGIASSCRQCTAEANREWRQNNPGYELGRKAPKKNYPRSPEKSKAWRLANPERGREYDRKWRRANPEKARAIKAVRIARKRGASGRHTGDQIKTLLVAQKLKCPNCRTSIRNGYHVDHIMPLALGGSNDISNIQLLCSSCNLIKRAKHPDVWARENGRLL